MEAETQSIHQKATMIQLVYWPQKTRTTLFTKIFLYSKKYIHFQSFADIYLIGESTILQSVWKDNL